MLLILSVYWNRRAERFGFWSPFSPLVFWITCKGFRGRNVHAVNFFAALSCNLVNFGWKVQLLIFMSSSFMILLGWHHNCGDHWDCHIFDLWVTECLAHFTQISEIETLRQRHRYPACVAILDQKVVCGYLREVVYNSPFPNDGFITQIYLMKLMTTY